MQDFRYAVRALGKQPMFAAVAVLTLAIGIGANTAIFSLVYQVLLKPLPYPSADRLVFVWNTYPLMGLPQASVSIPDYIDRKTQAPAIADAALLTGRSVSLAEGGQPEQLRALAVTPSFFSTLERHPFLGRGFAEDEAQPDADRFVVLTYGVWQSRFGGDASIIGSDARINGQAHRVVGVLPADFRLPGRDIDILLPFAFTPQQMSDQGRGNEFSTMIARLAPGATIEQLNGQMTAIVDRNLDRLPQFQAFARTSGFGGFAVDFREQLAGDVRTPLYVLQSLVLAVLLIACANVANLLLMRATGRSRELAIRSTLGAGHWRLFKQLIVEGLVLSMVGAIGGVLIGFAALRALVALTSDQLPAIAEATLHPPVLFFTLGLAVLTGVLFGIVPAVSVLRGTASATLKDDASRGSAGRGTAAVRSMLVIAEVALALMLLVGAGLLVKSFSRLQAVDPGFSPEHVLTAGVSLPASRYADAAARRVFWTRLLERVRALPGVSAAGLTSNIPLSGNVSSGSYTIVGYTPGASESAPHGRQEVVGGDYFRAMQIPLVEGRLFTGTDTADSPPVVVIDEYLKRRYFPDRSPIGQQIRRGGPQSPPFTIVGVVKTINAIDLAEPVAKERLYYPVTQQPRPGMALVLKTELEPTQLVAQVRAAVQSIDVEQPIADVRTMEAWIGRSLAERRVPMLLSALFGGVALLLAAIGIYGVLAFSVAQRIREFGIRQALGADRRAILSLVLKQGIRTAGIGLVLGLGASFWLSQYLQTLLFSIQPRDRTVFASVVGLLLAIALAACYVPARRATRIDPMEALRET